MKQFTKSLFIVLSVLFSFSYAFAETGSETEQNATGGGSSNVQVNGQSFYIDGTYIAGKGAAQKGEMTSKGFKLRTGTDGNRAVISVNTGYTITSVVINGIANYNAKEEGAAIVVTKVEVDGVETTFEGGEFPGKAASTSGKLTISGIKAQQSIAIYFDNSNSDGNQINAAWIVNWERPDATQPTITVSPKTINLIPEASTKLAVKVDPNTFTTAWVSDNEAVATVAEDGTVTAVAVGKANIINRWDTNADVADTAVVTVADFDATKYNIVKQFDFTTMGDITLTIEETAAGNIWNEANTKPNPVYFCTNDGLGDIAVQAVVKDGKGWSITSAGLLLAGGAGRCAAIGHLKAGQVVEIIYTGSDFFTGSKEDAIRKDDGAVKTALNDGIGRAIYKMEEDGMFGFEIIKGNAIEKIIVYEIAGPTVNTAIVNAGFNPEADPLGWDKVTSAQFYDLGMGLIGTYQVRGEHPAATVDETHLATEFAAGLECRWSTNYAAFTQTTAELPAGSYKLTFDVENTNATTTKANYENRFNVTVGETTYADESTEWMDGKSAWTTHTIAFTLTEASPITISLGYGTGSNNFGVGNTPALFVSHLTLEAINSIEIALIDLQAAIDAAQAKAATYTVGTELFTYAESEIKPLNDAIATAQAAYTAAESAEAVKSATETLNAFVATFAPVMNKPAADKAYKITNTTATGNLCIAEGKISVAQGATVKFTAVEGGYVLSKDSLYVFKTTDNNWTLSTTKNIAEAYVLTFNPVEGGYTIKGAKGLFGLDSTNEGSSVYANKAAANNGIWTIAEYDESAENALATALAALNAEIAVADSLLAIEANTEGREAFQTAINDARALLTSTDIEVINTGVNTLKAAEATFKAANFKAPIADGKYYLYNVAAQGFIVGGNDWGTRASITKVGGVEIEAVMADGKYELKTASLYPGKHIGFNGYVDNGDAANWTIVPVEGQEGVFTLSTDGTNVLFWDGGEVTTTSVGAMPATAENAYWKFISVEERMASLANATAENPVDATFLINNPNFSRAASTAAWTVSEDCTNKNLAGGANENSNAESFHSVFTLSQVLAGAPKGLYALTAQGFYRQDGSDNDNLPVFYANDEKATFLLKTGSENSMSDASASFSNGLYTIDPIYAEVADGGSLTIGAKLEVNTSLWCIWDNFVLTYYGAGANLDEVKNAAIIAELADLRTKAATLKDQVEVSAIQTVLDDALAATDNVSGTDAINAAVATMKAAVEKADAAILMKTKLTAMLTVMESTNVYSAEAFETYNRAYTEALAKYNEGEFKLAEAQAFENPEVLGWHSPNNVDDLLLSAWSIGADKAKDYDKALYINTWSVEGNNDGSNFKTPFFEYWTGDGESLGENKLTATMSNLEPGTYDVTAWVRVRAKNGYTAPAYGISLQANDGEAVNVADGAQVGTSQFYLKEVTATGIVAADGALNITFNVAADNNISWLSFKNVKFEKKTTVEPQDNVLALTLNVERYPGLGYGVTEAAVDFTEAKAFLGVETITTDMLRIVNPNDSLISDYAPYDGWFNGEGAAETWGDNTKVCVKFFEAIAGEGKYSICDMNGADEVGKTYSVKWALVANDKQVTYTINVKFVEKPVITLTFADLNKVDEQTVALTSELGKCYEGLTADVDVAAILAKLEVASLNDVTIYAVQSDGSLDDNYKLSTTDGWRNAAGDWQTWGNDAYFFVKTDFALESGQIYAAGGMDGKNTTEDWENPATYTATYAFVKGNDTHDAVVLKVTLTYTVPTGINAIARDAQNADIYNINGQKVNKAQKGLYIINGKKTVVK